MFELGTINDVLAYATHSGSREVMLWQDGEVWKPITSEELYGKVRAFVTTLQTWGVQKGDRVVIIAENRWEWPVCDFAILALGAVDVPLYSTLTPEQLGYMIRDSGAKVAVVSTQHQYEKLSSAGDLPSLQQVVVMDNGRFSGAENLQTLLISSSNLQQQNSAFDDLLSKVSSNDLATIIYTSGTTGEPKGVRLTHGNLASNLNVSTLDLGFDDQDISVSFLPLSHVTARHVDYALICHGVKLAYCTQFELLPRALKTVQPTIFVGVPRVYEKIRQTVESRSATSRIRGKLLAVALSVGRRNRNAILAGTRPASLAWRLADKLVFGKIQEAFGGRVRVFISGGAPLGMHTAGWFADAGIRIFEGYGLTETSPVLALNSPHAHKIGSVGKLLPNVEARFAPDGELEVRGPSVFHGYWNKVSDTAEAFTSDGWFKTGDIGALDADNFLFIMDRKKELLKTSGGKLIAPQPIENRLKASGLVSHAALVGDKHKFASVLLSPNFESLWTWAREHGVDCSDRRELIRHSEVVKMYQGVVDQVNSQLASFETIKRFALVEEDWTIEQGQLTPSMKLKRRVIEDRYAKEIAEFYTDEANSRA